MYVSYAVASSLIEGLLDGIQQAIINKGLDEKVPMYSTRHTIALLTHTYDMHELPKDNRYDDQYILVKDVVEPPGPGKDSICCDKGLNKFIVLEKKRIMRPAGKSDTSQSKRRLLSSQLSFNKHSDNSEDTLIKLQETQRVPSSKKSSKKAALKYNEKPMPVEPWGPFDKPEKMKDGTDVDVLVKRKRAAKMLLDEAFKAHGGTKGKRVPAVTK